MAVPGCPLCSGGPRSLPPPTQLPVTAGPGRETRASEAQNWALGSTQRGAYLGRKRSGPEDGRGEAGSEVMGLRGGACRYCWVTFAPRTSDSASLPLLWSPPLQLPHSTASPPRLGREPWGTNIPSAHFKGTAPSQDGPGAGPTPSGTVQARHGACNQPATSLPCTRGEIPSPARLPYSHETKKQRGFHG